MEKIEFKKIVKNTVEEFGFTYIKKAHYCESDELIVMINFQKSNFDNSFYINYGFLVKEINPDIKYPKENICDITGRFCYYSEDEIINEFNLDHINEEELIKSLKKGMEKTIIPVLEFGLEKYFEIYPKAKAMLKLSTKKYLGY